MLKTTEQARDLGGLNFKTHIRTISKSAYDHLENILRIKGLLSQQDVEKLVHAFIFSTLDYCVFTGLLKNLSESCS